MDEYSRNDSIILSGLTTHHKTWAHLGNPLDMRNEREHAKEQQLEALESEELSFLNLKHGTNIKSTHVSACRALGKNKRPGKRNKEQICEHKEKMEVLRET